MLKLKEDIQIYKNTLFSSENNSLIQSNATNKSRGLNNNDRNKQQKIHITNNNHVEKENIENKKEDSDAYIGKSNNINPTMKKVDDLYKKLNEKEKLIKEMRMKNVNNLKESIKIMNDTNDDCYNKESKYKDKKEYDFISNDKFFFENEEDSLISDLSYALVSSNKKYYK